VSEQRSRNHGKQVSYHLATYQSQLGPRSAIRVNGAVFDLEEVTAVPNYATVLGVLADWDSADKLLRNVSKDLSKTQPLSNVKLLAPVHYPTAIYGAGANYVDHVCRMAEILGLPLDPDPHEVGLKPWHFMKPSHCAVGTGAGVPIRTDTMDWEVELAAVIGRTARNVSVSDALNYVAGYTVANDLSARGLTVRPHLAPTSPFKYDWIGQKVFEGSCPLGPWIVPARDIPNPQNLRLKLTVNGQLRQDSSTSMMIFSIAEQVAHLSSCVKLRPGDVILTGTPSGVGAETKDFLKSGDMITAEVERVGVLTTVILNSESFA
jgi:2-keto-4-pentenoate hydratase/2-oxohepta-3-ene-1,7-dioic acid hydratase in catechol pathway